MTEVDRISVKELEDHLYDYQIIDIRPPEKFREKHLKTSINIPFDNFAEHFQKISSQKDIIVVCQEGELSKQFIQILKSSDKVSKNQSIYNLSKGLQNVPSHLFESYRN